MPMRRIIVSYAAVFAACLVLAIEALAATPANSVARTTQAKPLLIGNWADPSILKDGDDYYMTHSSFEYQPGYSSGTRRTCELGSRSAELR